MSFYPLRAIILIMENQRVLRISLLIFMLLLIGLIFSLILFKTKEKSTPLTYHYVQALSLKRPVITEPPDEEIAMSEPEEEKTGPREEELSQEEMELIRYITGQHQVKKGESFSLITGEYWDDVYLWPDLYVRNDMISDDPDLIFPEEIIDIYNRLGKGDVFTEQEMEEIRKSYISVYRTFKSLGEKKTNSARALLYTATKYDKNFMEHYRQEIDPSDKRVVEQWIAEQGYLE